VAQSEQSSSSQASASSVGCRVNSVSAFDKHNTNPTRLLVRSPEWHLSSPLFPLRTHNEQPRYPRVLFLHHSGSPTRQTKLIQESYNPTSSHRLSPDEHRRLQSELYELQRKWEAWGLIVPFLFEHADPNVQFFGAHTAQVKISRDWYAPDTHSMHPRSLSAGSRESFPAVHRDELIPFLLNITGRSISIYLGKVIVRKLFVAVCRFCHRRYLLLFGTHVLFPVIRSRFEACAPRSLSLAKLDRCDRHGTLERGRYQ